MPDTTIHQRARIHRLVDTLPDDELRVAERMLSFLLSLGPVDLRASSPSRPTLLTGSAEEPDAAFWEAIVNALEDDEPLTDEDREAIREGLAELAAGESLTTEDVLRLLAGER